MTTENNQPNVSDDLKASSAAPSEGDSIESLRQEIENLKKKNGELLGEKKTVQTKLSAFEKEKLESEKKLMEDQGKFKDLYEKEKGRTLTYAQKLKERVMDSTIKEALRKSGCTDENKLSKLLGFKSVANYGERVKFDDDFNADSNDLEKFVAEVKTEFLDFGFFDVQTPNTKEVHPSSFVGNGPQQKTEGFKEQAKKVLADLGGL